MASKEFWRDCAVRFKEIDAKYQISAEYHEAGWNATDGRWHLSGAPEDVCREFRTTASLAAVALGFPDNHTEWLDILRRRQWGFEWDGHVTSLEAERASNSGIQESSAQHTIYAFGVAAELAP